MMVTMRAHITVKNQRGIGNHQVAVATLGRWFSLNRSQWSGQLLLNTRYWAIKPRLASSIAVFFGAGFVSCGFFDIVWSCHISFGYCISHSIRHYQRLTGKLARLLVPKSPFIKSI